MKKIKTKNKKQWQMSPEHSNNSIDKTVLHTHKARRSKLEKENIHQQKVNIHSAKANIRVKANIFIINDNQYFNQMPIVVIHLTCEIL
jgi:hypothetical protein